MRQITIEIPQSVSRNYKVASENSAREILLYLEHLAKEQIIIEVSEIPVAPIDQEK